MYVSECLQNVSQLCFFNSAGSQLTCCDTGPWSSEDLFVSGFRPTQEVSPTVYGNVTIFGEGLEILI